MTHLHSQTKKHTRKIWTRLVGGFNNETSICTSSRVEMNSTNGADISKKGSPRPPVSREATFGNFGRLLHQLHSPTGTLSDKCIGGASIRTPAPRRYQAGRTLLEMLAVLAIIGVLSVAALMGFRYAMNKHKANSIYHDVHLLALHVMDTGKDTVPSDFYPQSGMTFGIDTTTYANGFVVTVSDVSEKVCDKIMTVDDTSIEEIYVGSEGNTACSGSQMMGFMFLYNGSLSSGGGTSGGSGSGTEPEDPCAGIIPTSDCNLTADVMDENGCVTVKKITCAGDTYCSVGTCEPCPAAETCDGESCCALTGAEDVCGRPTKKVGTITTVTHSDLNANGCCTDISEESCSLNPVTARTCTPTCDGTCQSDGSCRPNCENGSTYNETAGQCCEELTVTECQMVTAATSGTCPTLTNVADGTTCTTTDNQSGTCQSGVCEAEGCTITQQVCSEGTDSWCCDIGQQCGSSVGSCITCDAASAYNNQTLCTACGWEWQCSGYTGRKNPTCSSNSCGGDSFCEAYFPGSKWELDYEAYLGSVNNSSWFSGYTCRGGTSSCQAVQICIAGSNASIIGADPADCQSGLNGEDWTDFFLGFIYCSNFSLDSSL